MFRRVSAVTLVSIVLGAGGLSGCRHMPRSEAEARQCVDEAVAAHDGAALYKCLDQRTRWAVDSAYRDQSVTRSLIAARYPEDTASVMLAPLAAAAEPDAPHYFAAVAGPDPLAHVPTRHFVRYADKWYGLADLSDDWTQRQEHADHELKTVRENLRLLDQADRAEKANPK